jgi:hypothetical protein
MFIRKKPARSHALGEPILHADHKRPVTRRDFVSAGLASTPAIIMAPAWLGALLQSGKAKALSTDMQALLAASQCNVPSAAVSITGIPFICFDLSGGANLVGSEVLVGVRGGQSNLLSANGYAKLGLPSEMIPTSSSNISNTLGLLWHADGGILRGILSKATTPSTAAGTNGAVICALSQNDTGNNPHNPMYGIAKAGAKGKLLTLIGTQSSVSGGNSAAPTAEIDPSLQPTKISQPSDAVALVKSGSGAADPLAVAVLESVTRISGGTAPYQPNATDPTAAFTGKLTNPASGGTGVRFYADAMADAKLKNQVRCAYVKAANTADAFGSSSALDPAQDFNIVGGASPLFTAADLKDPDIAKTAAVMKLVLNGYAGAGTVTLGGFDYHDSTRATGEMRNYKAGQMIGAVLEYAQRVGSPVMIYVFSDGSLSANSSIDESSQGRGKLGWQGDNQDTASTFFLVYSPKGRPQLRNGAASQQIGYFSADGSVVTNSSPAANAVNQLAEVVILNYMGLLGTSNQFSTVLPMQGLGSAAAQAALTVFAPIV